uniref:hypothetical protein n=1 Tax=Spizellomyces sp. 'palustris' TaxID=117820 RepID=UPI0010FC1516|nr:hypothetical protein [Spizellomyces sp. 'palustris']QCQ69023.1 hypothetical protein [Spizellomyces sp. 'palustris']
MTIGSFLTIISIFIFLYIVAFHIFNPNARSDISRFLNLSGSKMLAFSLFALLTIDTDTSSVDLLFAFVPLISLSLSAKSSAGSTNSTPTTSDLVDMAEIEANYNAIDEEEAEEESTRLTYIVSNLNQPSFSKIYNTRRDLLANSNDLFGFVLGRNRLASIISNGSILHTNKCTFIISVTGLDL